MWDKNGKTLLHLFFLLLILALIAVPALPSPLSADGPQGLRAAPLNPAFVDYMKKKQHAALKGGQAAGQASKYGYVPPSVDLSYMESLRAPAGRPLRRDEAGDAPPASFDWRTYGNVTPVKDQGAYNTGWAFANTAVMESRVSITGGPASENYSEQALACCTDPSWTYSYADRRGYGGNDYMAQDTFIKKGARPEDCQPYDTGTINNEGCSDCTPGYMTTNFVWIAMTDNTIEARNAIRTAIQTYGPVTVAYYQPDNDSNLYAGNIYYYTGSEYANNLVSIVGWDDAIEHPLDGGSGAWLAKNSRGTSWGNSGYFWLCYGKSNATDFGSLRGVKAYNSMETLYSLDEAGWVDNVGYGDITSWMANIFTASPAGNLTHVDFYTGGVSTQFDIRVYKSGNINSLGTAATTQSGACGNAPGYYSIQLNSPVALSNGQAFTVAVKMTTPDYNFPIPVENAYTGGREPPIQTYRSYIKHSDSDGWEDLGASYYWNACLRARIREHYHQTGSRNRGCLRRYGHSRNLKRDAYR